jgi:nickel/cobalt exporter
MHGSLQQHFRPVTGLLVLAVLALAPLAARADTVASLLGNFTVNQYCGLRLSTAAVDVHYAVVFGQLPALRELHLADADGDGVTTQAERDAYIERLAPGFAEGLKLVVDGSPVSLHARHWTSSLPTEQGGFSLRLDVDFSGLLPAAPTDARHTLTFTNQNYSGQIGWNEITVQAPPSIAVFDTDAFSTSLTAGLTAAVRELPSTGPLAERSVHLSFVQGSAPPGAKVLPARAGTPPRAAPLGAQDSSGNGETLWLQRQTKNLVGLISAPHVAPHVALLALIIALVLGAMHALSPGHGKTIVGAYLIGSRGTPRHALFLGVTVTVTHTVGVFVLGFATLVASRYIVPERLFPILSLISGLLVLGMGVFLLAQRWRAAQAYDHHEASHSHAHADGHHDHHGHADHDHSDHAHAHHGHSHHRHTHEEHTHAHHSHSHEHPHEHHGGHDHVPSGPSAQCQQPRSRGRAGRGGRTHTLARRECAFAFTAGRACRYGELAQSPGARHFRGACPLPFGDGFALGGRGAQQDRLWSHPRRGVQCGPRDDSDTRGPDFSLRAQPVSHPRRLFALAAAVACGKRRSHYPGRRRALRRSSAEHIYAALSAPLKAAEPRAPPALPIPLVTRCGTICAATLL